MSSATSRTRRVVIADDDALIRLVIRSALLSAGYDVLEADSGTTALALVTRARVDVAILDANMPGPGLDALIASIAELADPPAVVVLTGDSTIVPASGGSYSSSSQGAGLAWLTKPVELDTLIATVERLSEAGDGPPTPSSPSGGIADERS